MLRISPRPTQIGIWFRSNITIGDSREVFRALGLALWIFRSSGQGEVDHRPCQRPSEPGTRKYHDS